MVPVSTLMPSRWDGAGCEQNLSRAGSWGWPYVAASKEKKAKITAREPPHCLENIKKNQAAFRDEGPVEAGSCRGADVPAGGRVYRCCCSCWRNARCYLCSLCS